VRVHHSGTVNESDDWDGRTELRRGARSAAGGARKAGVYPDDVAEFMAEAAVGDYDYDYDHLLKTMQEWVEVE
jgi:hypothetical protein